MRPTPFGEMSLAFLGAGLGIASLVAVRFRFRARFQPESAAFDEFTRELHRLEAENEAARESALRCVRTTEFDDTHKTLGDSDPRIDAGWEAAARVWSSGATLDARIAYSKMYDRAQAAIVAVDVKSCARLGCTGECHDAITFAYVRTITEGWRAAEAVWSS